MIQTESVQLSGEIIDRLSLELQNEMEASRFSNADKQRYRLSLEDVLQSMRDHFGDGYDIVVQKEGNRKFLRVVILVKGEEYNPLKKAEGDTFSDYTDMILSDIGEELSYNYHNGTNRIALKLKKNGHDGWAFRKNYFAVGVPMACQNLMGALIGCSDAIMLGFISSACLSAVTLANQIVMIFNYVLACVCTTAIVLVARCWGTRNRVGSKTVTDVSVLYGLTLSVLFFLLTFFFPSTLMRFFTADAGLNMLGTRYLRIVSFSMLLQGFTEVYLSVLRVINNSRRIKVISFVGPLINLVLNPLFIFGWGIFPRMEVEGAAVATVITKLVMFFIVLHEARSQNIIIFSLIDALHVDKKAFVAIGRFSAIDTARKTGWVLSVATGTAILSHIGNDVISAVAVATLVMNISFSSLDAMGGACGIFVSHELGRGNRDRAMLQVNRGLWINMGLGAVIGVVLLASIPLILKIYSHYPPRVLELLKQFLLVASFLPVANSVGPTSVKGVFASGGDYVFAFWLDIITYWGVVIPMGLLCAHILRAPHFVTFAVLNAGNIVRLPMAIHRIRSGKWMYKYCSKTIMEFLK